jgi:subtilase family serine protease
MASTPRIAAVGAAGVLLAAGATAARPGAASGLRSPVPAVMGHVVRTSLAAPPDPAFCAALLHVSCYRPAQMRRAYDLDALLDRHLDGRHRTIAIVDSFGAPDIAADLHHFDASFGLPDPPSLTVIHPAGDPPAFDPANLEMGLWAVETSLDVEWAHVMAPGARLLLVETPVAETQGIAGFPEIARAEEHVVEHHLADVISLSFGTAEQTFPSTSVLRGLRLPYVEAAGTGISVLAATGDTGPTLPLSSGACCFPVPVTSWPASDPLVTAVGGTRLQLDATGERIAPDRVWNDAGGAGGGGLSAVFERPHYQDRVRSTVGDRRGTPDLSLSAAASGPVDVYMTLPGPAGPIGGWSLAGGTSEATPLLAGIVADADEAAGHRLGPLNDRLYALARKGDGGIVDVVTGSTTVALCLRACATGAPVLLPVPGSAAAPGYDLATGLGTVDAARLVAALARDER